MKLHSNQLFYGGTATMSKRGENIHKRKDGRWEGRYIKFRRPDGKIHYGSVYGKTYRETKEKLRMTSTTVQYSSKSPKDDMYYKELLDMWLNNNRVRLKQATLTKYQNIITTHIIPELGDVKLSHLNAANINSFLANKLENGRLDRTGGLAPSYVRSIMLVITASIKFATNEQLMEPLKSPIYKPSIEKKEYLILTRDEQKKLEQYIRYEPDNTKLGILLSLYAGLRIGEVCALTWDDIDLKNKIIYVRHTVARIKTEISTETVSTKLIIDAPKTKASMREIPITANLHGILLSQFKVSVSPYVISDTNNFVNPRTFEYRYHRVLKECGVSSVNFHILRHTFASRCVEAGVDVKSLSEILGHGNVSITLNTYVHSSMEQKREQLEKLDSSSF